MIWQYLVYNKHMSLDILDQVKLVHFYKKCTTLYLTDITPLIIHYIIKTQQYVSITKYNMCILPDIIIDIKTITEHTTHLLLNMLFHKYPEFNQDIHARLTRNFISCTITRTYLAITHVDINKNMLSLNLYIKKGIYIHGEMKCASYVNCGTYILKL